MERRCLRQFKPQLWMFHTLRSRVAYNQWSHVVLSSNYSNDSPPPLLANPSDR